jgi:hypothetical protein
MIGPASLRPFACFGSLKQDVQNCVKQIDTGIKTAASIQPTCQVNGSLQMNRVSGNHRGRLRGAGAAMTRSIASITAHLGYFTS